MDLQMAARVVLVAARDSEQSVAANPAAAQELDLRGVATKLFLLAAGFERPVAIVAAGPAAAHHQV